jgi:NADH-quinone oxidoreductase subunit M
MISRINMCIIIEWSIESYVWVVVLYVTIQFNISFTWLNTTTQYILPMTLYLFYVVNAVFFCCNDFLSLGLLYEFQTIPLLLFINYSRHMVKKGIGISNILLVLYNLLSGLLLYTSLYTIYSYNHTYLLSKHILVLYLASHYNNVSDNQSLTYSVLCILLSGFIKLAVYPFHIWLGKVHVEAPTVGSILLAGVSLKTGFFIHLYFLTYINSIPVTYLYTMIVVLFIGVVFNCLNVFYQIDSKRWIALYSIIHMNLYYLHIFIILIGFIHLNHSVSMFILMVLVYGMIGHSIISGGLFL